MSDKDTVVCKIKSLRVKDLQRQLEKRGINQSGKKAVLIKRLKDVLNSSFIDLSEQSITGKSGKELVENRYNNSKVPSKRKKFIFSSDWEC